MTSEPKAKRLLRYPGDIKEDIEYSPRTSRVGLSVCKSKYRQLQRRIKSLQTKNRRKTKRITTLKGLLQDLRNKFTLSDHARSSIEVGFFEYLTQFLFYATFILFWFFFLIL